MLHLKLSGGEWVYVNPDRIVMISGEADEPARVVLDDGYALCMAFQTADSVAREFNEARQNVTRDIRVSEGGTVRLTM